MVRDGSLSSLRTTFRRIAITAATAALVVAAPPVFAADPAFVAFPVLTPNAGLSSITLGSDGAMWFTGSGVGVIGRIGADGVVTERATADPASTPAGIATGPDGALWVTLQNSEAIARMTPVGGFETYPLPADESSPTGITLGPDGAMWFTERMGDRIGRIDPATGAITEFALASPSGPTEITTGPDGALWFTEPSASGLGRLDPTTGGVSRVDLPVGSVPTDVAGGGGALWVTLRATNQIARVAPDGTFELLPVPTPASRPSHIVADPANGVLWVTERATSTLLRLSFDGTMAEFGAATNAGLNGVAVDPAGRPWVTQTLLNTIGLLDLEVAPPDTTPPTISISSPGAGAWTVGGSDSLAAAYACADEGGSGLAACEGTVADGDPLPDDAIGVATLDVHAADAAGNTADASAAYLVFASARGSVLDPADPAPARVGEGLTLELGMNQPAKAAPLASAMTTQVDCGTGTAMGDPGPADVRTRVTHLGQLSLRWDTSRTWSRQCRTLTLGFSAQGWTGADAVFGPVAFGTTATKR